MTDPSIPPVPTLSDERIAAYRDGLLAELVSSPRRQHNRRLAVGGIGTATAAAALAVALVLTIASPGPQSAFAGWSATPAQASTSQTATAESVCAAGGTASASGGAPLSQISPSEWHTVLTDVRGPFTAVVVQADEGRATMSCLLGAGSRLLYRNGGFTPGQPAPVASGKAEVSFAGAANIYGQSGGTFRRIEGRAGASVTGVTVILKNGTDVHATTASGWFLAWWPGSEPAASLEVTTTSGVNVQQIT